MPKMLGGERRGGAELQPHVRVRRDDRASVMDLLSQHESFLRAIYDAPDDDTPRLVYADFLEEHGDPDKAAYIRMECEAARADDTKRSELDPVRLAMIEKY